MEHGLNLNKKEVQISMASMPQHGVNNEILVSESDDEDGDDVSDIATRTRPSYKKNTKSPVPRPVEPKVFVQNEQAFSRSGEVSEERDLGYGDIWSGKKVMSSGQDEF